LEAELAAERSANQEVKEQALEQQWQLKKTAALLEQTDKVTTERAAEAAEAQARAAEAVSRSCACIGSPCLRHCGHGASIGACQGSGEPGPGRSGGACVGWLRAQAYVGPVGVSRSSRSSSVPGLAVATAQRGRPQLLAGARAAAGTEAEAPALCTQARVAFEAVQAKAHEEALMRRAAEEAVSVLSIGLSMCLSVDLPVCLSACRGAERGLIAHHRVVVVVVVGLWSQEMARRDAVEKAAAVASERAARLEAEKERMAEARRRQRAEVRARETEWALEKVRAELVLPRASSAPPVPCVFR
jgi:hypothetical protein